ncbi:MAG: glycosyltransferase family 4 protein, partial [Planctomycetota bacterium]|nr:glycosyltransferase family 4 protein [Planctomycetota bacterium]
LVNLLLFRRINRLIPVANKVKEDVLRNNRFLSEDKLFVLENSVDYERFAKISISKEDAKRLLGTSPDAFVFGTIGRLAPTKGLPYLIEAFAKVKQQMPSAQLVLVGDGRLRNELEQRAAKTLCADSIHFLGHRNNTPELLRAMDVFVLPSIAEGMPRAILEAMAGGVPCVATGVGGIPELLDGGNMGLLVPPADTDALAQAMLTVANMPKDKLDKLIQNAQSKATQACSHDVVRKKLARLYESEFKACTKQ